MSALNDLMNRLLGTNWKTTVTGWATALASFAALILAVFQQGKWAIVAGALSAVAKVLNGLVAADAPGAPVDTTSPKAGSATVPWLHVLATVAALILAGIVMTGCTKVQGYTNQLAEKVPGGRAALDTFRKSEGKSVGLVELPADAVSETVFVDNAGARLTNGVRAVTTIRYERPLVDSAVAPVPEAAIPAVPATNAPVPSVTGGGLLP